MRRWRGLGVRHESRRGTERGARSAAALFGLFLPPPSLVRSTASLRGNFEFTAEAAFRPMDPSLLAPLHLGHRGVLRVPVLAPNCPGVLEFKKNHLECRTMLSMLKCYCESVKFNFPGS